jgi:glycine cleavage system H protein
MRINEFQIPEDLFYDQNDLWLKINGTETVIGMSDFGQNNTGDILYLEILAAGATVARGERIGSIESGKWVGNLYSPLSGMIVEVNRDAMENPRQINQDAYGRGWMLRMQITDRMNCSR